MRNKDIEKIKSAPNKKKYLLFLVPILIFLLLLTYFLYINKNVKQNIYIDNIKFSVEVVSDEQSRQKGLSRRDKLNEYHAMLFDFKEEGYWNIWMKDMKFPIDALWLNKDKKIISIEKNLQPGSYPKNYGPKEKSFYVIELPAGTLNKHNITNNSIIKL